MTIRPTAFLLASALMAALPAFAQTTPTPATPPATTTAPGGTQARHARIQLTDQQKAVMQEQRAKIQAVYTPEQQAQLKAADSGKSWKTMTAQERTEARAKRRAARQAVQASLTADQKRQIQAAHAAMRDALTPDQRKAMEEGRGKHQMRNKTGGSPS